MSYVCCFSSLLPRLISYEVFFYPKRTCFLSVPYFCMTFAAAKVNNNVELTIYLLLQKENFQPN